MNINYSKCIKDVTIASLCSYIRNISGSETAQSVTGVFAGEYGIISQQTD